MSFHLGDLVMCIFMLHRTINHGLTSRSLGVDELRVSEKPSQQQISSGFEILSLLESSVAEQPTTAGI